MDRFSVRRGAPLLVAFFLAAFTACGGDDGPTDPNGGGGGGGGTPTLTDMVGVDDNAFDPDLIQVSPGDTVTWSWNSTSNPHNVTFSSGSIASSSTESGSPTFSAEMPSTPGDYDYTCTIHASIGMTGTVRVQ